VITKATVIDQNAPINITKKTNEYIMLK